MQDRRWPRHKGQVGLQRVWRRLLLCCSCEHQEESLDKEALIVVPVSGILILVCVTDSLSVNLLLRVGLPVNAVQQIIQGVVATLDWRKFFATSGHKLNVDA